MVVAVVVSFSVFDEHVLENDKTHLRWRSLWRAILVILSSFIPEIRRKATTNIQVTEQ